MFAIPTENIKRKKKKDGACNFFTVNGLCYKTYPAPTTEYILIFFVKLVFLGQSKGKIYCLAIVQKRTN